MNIEINAEAVNQNVRCKYCTELEDIQTKPCLQCKECKEYVHKHCVRSLGTPGDFLGDVFFLFTCAECSLMHNEVFLRHKMQWLNVVSLVLYNLMQKSPGISNRGFFHWRTHVSSYIDKHWVLLFGKQTKRKKNWTGTVSGILSHFSNSVFLSGSNTLGETGWWRLANSMSPAMVAQMKNKQSVNQSSVAKTKKKCYSDESKDHRANKFSESSSIPEEFSNNCPPMLTTNAETREIFEMPTIEGMNDDDSMSDLDPSLLQVLSDNCENVIFGTSSFDSVLFPLIKNDVMDNVSPLSIKAGVVIQTTDDSNVRNENTKPIEMLNMVKKIKKNDSSKKVKGQSTDNQVKDNVSNSFPWDSDEEGDIYDDRNLTPLNEYEELSLLKDVNSILQNKLKNAEDKTNAERKRIYVLQRMKAKLNLRKVKRHKGLKLFNFDNCVKQLMGFPVEKLIWQKNYQERVLDRFQNSRHSLYGTNFPPYLLCGTRLISQWDPIVFQSPYSGRFLKPFIRRDTESKPLWLKIMTEVQMKSNKNNSNFILQPQASIDYCYVQPQHIAAISSLCSQVFWPGVDLSEILQYPDFTCVALYKKLVIGFACLVPDVDFNTAYLTFLLTRPEWRRAGIATFMLYHLLQTCNDKDVILHVSATNPAVFLYQKFGFKIEEMIQNFYDKYFEITSKECKHALLLRLTR